MFSEVNDESGFVGLGVIKVERNEETGTLLFTYRMYEEQYRQWAFIWQNDQNHIEICEHSVGPDGEDCYSMRDSIGWGDESDATDNDRLTRISYLALTWALEHADKFKEGF